MSSRPAGVRPPDNVAAAAAAAAAGAPVDLGPATALLLGPVEPTAADVAALDAPDKAALTTLVESLMRQAVAADPTALLGALGTGGVAEGEVLGHFLDRALGHAGARGALALLAAGLCGGAGDSSGPDVRVPASAASTASAGLSRLSDCGSALSSARGPRSSGGDAGDDDDRLSTAPASARDGGGATFGGLQLARARPVVPSIWPVTSFDGRDGPLGDDAALPRCAPASTAGSSAGAVYPRQLPVSAWGRPPAAAAAAATTGARRGPPPPTVTAGGRRGSAAAGTDSVAADPARAAAWAAAFLGGMPPPPRESGAGGGDGGGVFVGASSAAAGPARGSGWPLYTRQPPAAVSTTGAALTGTVGALQQRRFVETLSRSLVAGTAVDDDAATASAGTSLWHPPVAAAATFAAAATDRGSAGGPLAATAAPVRGPPPRVPALSEGERGGLCQRRLGGPARRAANGGNDNCIDDNDAGDGGEGEAAVAESASATGGAAVAVGAGAVAALPSLWPSTAHAPGAAGAMAGPFRGLPWLQQGPAASTVAPSASLTFAPSAPTGGGHVAAVAVGGPFAAFTAPASLSSSSAAAVRQPALPTFHMPLSAAAPRGPPLGPAAASRRIAAVAAMHDPRLPQPSAAVAKLQANRRTVSSRFRGVSLTKSGQWRVQVGYKGRRLSVGHYASELEAAHAYDATARALHVGTATLNFAGEAEDDQVAPGPSAPPGAIGHWHAHGAAVARGVREALAQAAALDAEDASGGADVSNKPVPAPAPGTSRLHTFGPAATGMAGFASGAFGSVLGPPQQQLPLAPLPTLPSLLPPSVRQPAASAAQRAAEGGGAAAVPWAPPPPPRLLAVAPPLPAAPAPRSGHAVAPRAAEEPTHGGGDAAAHRAPLPPTAPPQRGSGVEPAMPPLQHAASVDEYTRPAARPPPAAALSRGASWGSQGLLRLEGGGHGASWGSRAGAAAALTSALLVDDAEPPPSLQVRRIREGGSEVRVRTTRGGGGGCAPPPPPLRVVAALAAAAAAASASLSASASTASTSSGGTSGVHCRAPALWSAGGADGTPPTAVPPSTATALAAFALGALAQMAVPAGGLGSGSGGRHAAADAMPLTAAAGAGAGATAVGAERRDGDSDDDDCGIGGDDDDDDGDDDDYDNEEERGAEAAQRAKRSARRRQRQPPAGAAIGRGAWAPPPAPHLRSGTAVGAAAAPPAYASRKRPRAIASGR